MTSSFYHEKPQFCIFIKACTGPFELRFGSTGVFRNQVGGGVGWEQIRGITKHIKFPRRFYYYLLKILNTDKNRNNLDFLSTSTFLSLPFLNRKRWLMRVLKVLCSSFSYSTEYNNNCKTSVLVVLGAQKVLNSVIARAMELREAANFLVAWH